MIRRLVLLATMLGAAALAQTAAIRILQVDPTVNAGGQLNFTLRITNTGTSAWSPLGPEDCHALYYRYGGSFQANCLATDNYAYTIRMEAHQLDSADYVNDYYITNLALPSVVGPGQTVDVNEYVMATVEPGRYRLAFIIGLPGDYAFMSRVLNSPWDSLVLGAVADITVNISGTPGAGGAGIIKTIAGTGAGGYGGDGGPATAAQIDMSAAFALDASGNLYISDNWNQRIRKVTPYGVISTVAGTGAAGYWGDGGPALNAELHDPWGVVVDDTGVIYFAEWANNCVRKITPDGTISTIAGNGSQGYYGDGGQATLAQLNGPAKLALYRGMLYIADTANHAVRVLGTDGTISTVAGTGIAGYSGDGGQAKFAQLNDPVGLGVDNSGNLYVAEEGNHCIRKIAVDGTISTVAGNGFAGYAGDGGPAQYARFNTPESVDFDYAGNMYIADALNSAIRKISTDGTISTVAGTGAWGYSGDGGPATSAQLYYAEDVQVDPTGALYVLDTYNERVRKVSYVPLIPPASIDLDNLSFPYDGMAHCPTVTTMPAGLSASVTGCQNAIGAGQYPVTATITDPNYQAATVSGMVTITPAAASVAWSNLTQNFDGVPHCPTVTTAPAGLAYTLSGCPRTNPGTYTVNATITDKNYAGSGQTQFTIANNGTVAVMLADSTGNPLAGGAVQYYSGAWKPFGSTDANGRATLTLPVGTYAFAMTYAGGRVQFNQNTGTNPLVAFQTRKVQVTLQDSAGNPLDVGTVQYYAGSWLTFGTGTTSGGRVSMELLPASYSFAMTYAGGRIQKNQDVTTMGTVAFQTRKAQVTLQDSTGSPLDSGTVQYYAGSWLTFGAGSTSGGQVAMEMLPTTYAFAMTYAGGRVQKNQDITSAGTVAFQTTRVLVTLQDSGGKPLDVGTVQYYASSWLTFGTGSTSGGRATMEMLPTTYSFAMTYAGGRVQMSQAVSNGVIVAFQTGAVHSVNCNNYYAGVWRTFTDMMQLLPATYTFRFGDGFADTAYTIQAGTVNQIH